MASFTHGSNAKLYLGGRDLTSYFNKAEIAKTVDVVETSAFNDTSKKYIPGIPDATLKAEGMLDESVAAASGSVLHTQLGATATRLSYLPNGDTVGQSGYGMVAQNTDTAITSPVDGVNAITFSAQSSTGAERIVSHRALSSLTAAGIAVAGTATVVDNGAATTTGGVGYLHPTAVTSGTVTITVQDSADNSTFTDLLAFTATSSTLSQRVTVAGTVRRYTRAVWAGGASGGGTITAFVGFGRTPYL